MMQGIEASWVVYGVVALLALLIAWRLLSRGKSTRDRSYKPDVLDHEVCSRVKFHARSFCPAR